MRTLAKYLAVI